MPAIIKFNCGLVHGLLVLTEHMSPLILRMIFILNVVPYKLLKVGMFFYSIKKAQCKFIILFESVLLK